MEVTGGKRPDPGHLSVDSDSLKAAILWRIVETGAGFC